MTPTTEELAAILEGYARLNETGPLDKWGDDMRLAARRLRAGEAVVAKLDAMAEFKGGWVQQDDDEWKQVQTALKQYKETQ